MADFQTILENLAAQLPWLRGTAISFCYVAGIFFAFRSVLQLKQYSMQRSMMTQQPEIRGAIVYILVASVMLYIPTAWDAMIDATFGYHNPIAYVATGNEKPWEQMMPTIYKIIEFIGLIAFIRGWIILSSLGDHTPQHGITSKGITHVLGGVCAINIIGFKEMLENTLGI